jgi:hypothetical protein
MRTVRPSRVRGSEWGPVALTVFKTGSLPASRGGWVRLPGASASPPSPAPAVSTMYTCPSHERLDNPADADDRHRRRSTRIAPAGDLHRSPMIPGLPPRHHAWPVDSRHSSCLRLRASHYSRGPRLEHGGIGGGSPATMRSARRGPVDRATCSPSPPCSWWRLRTYGVVYCCVRAWEGCRAVIDPSRPEVAPSGCPRQTYHALAGSIRTGGQGPQGLLARSRAVGRGPRRAGHIERTRNR